MTALKKAVAPKKRGKNKPKPIIVHIRLVLDASVSMAPLRDRLISGVNEFLSDQRSKPGECRLTLVQFAPYRVMYDAVDIRDVPDLTRADYNPTSMTPLLEAEGRTITAGIERERARAAAGKRAEAVLFVTYTDGKENTSVEWTFDALTAAKKEREEAGWAFMYLGAGHDAYGQSAQMGTFAANTVSTSADAAGMETVFRTVSEVASSYRSMAFAGDSSTLRSATKDVYGALGVDKPEDGTGTTRTASKARPQTPRGRRVRS